MEGWSNTVLGNMLAALLFYPRFSMWKTQHENCWRNRLNSRCDNKYNMLERTIHCKQWHIFLSDKQIDGVFFFSSSFFPFCFRLPKKSVPHRMRQKFWSDNHWIYYVCAAKINNGIKITNNGRTHFCMFWSLKVCERANESPENGIVRKQSACGVPMCNIIMIMMMIIINNNNK